MAYPNTSAEDIAEKQYEIDELRDLLKRFYSAAQIGANMEDPTAEEIEEYTEHMQGLMQEAEELIPELVNPEEDPYIPEEIEYADKMFLPPDPTLD